MAMYLVDTDNRFEHNVKTSLAAGTIAAGIETLLLPSEAKQALKNTIIGEDKFLKNTEKELTAASQTIAKDINIPEAMKVAKEAYPGIKAVGSQIGKGLASTFAFVSLSILGFRYAEEKIFASESKKNLDKEA